MDNNEGLIGSILGSWIVAALAGVLAAVLLWVLGDWTFMQGAFAGAVVFVLAGAIISWIMRPLPAPGEAKIGKLDAKPKPAKPAAATKPVAAAPKPTTEAPKPAAAAPKAAAAKPASAVSPSAPLAGQAELAQRKGSWKYEGEAKPVPAKAAPAKKPAAKDGKPELFDAPSGAADDLKLISGVGPKLEATLNELGVWHFSQVASWKKKEVAWVDERLKFKGRIERDDWIGQAKILAKGGETEFSKRKKK